MNILVVLVAVWLAAMSGHHVWQRRQQNEKRKMLARACQFALDRYDSLVCPKLEVITEPRLKTALMNAKSSQEVELLNFILDHQSDFGDAIDSYEEFRLTDYMVADPILVSVYIYGINRSKLESLQSRLQLEL